MRSLVMQGLLDLDLHSRDTGGLGGEGAVGMWRPQPPSKGQP